MRYRGAVVRVPSRESSGLGSNPARANVTERSTEATCSYSVRLQLYLQLFRCSLCAFICKFVLKDTEVIYFVIIGSLVSTIGS